MCNSLNALIHPPFQPHGWAGPPNPDLTWSACWHSHIVNATHSIRFNLSLPNTACYIPNMTHIRQPMSARCFDWSEGKVGRHKWWELWNSGKVDYVHLHLALTYRFWPDCVAATSSSTFKMDRSNYMRFKQSSSTLWPQVRRVSTFSVCCAHKGESGAREPVQVFTWNNHHFEPWPLDLQSSEFTNSQKLPGFVRKRKKKKTCQISARGWQCLL